MRGHVGRRFFVIPSTVEESLIFFDTGIARDVSTFARHDKMAQRDDARERGVVFQHKNLRENGDLERAAG